MASKIGPRKSLEDENRIESPITTTETSPVFTHKRNRGAKPNT